jgi:hypothetical protein
LTNGRLFVLVAAAHVVLTYLLTLWDIGWSMAALDSDRFEAPVGLQIVHLVTLCFSLPALWPMARGALFLGFADPINDVIYWPLPIVNSMLVSAVVLGARSIRKRRAR